MEKINIDAHHVTRESRDKEIVELAKKEFIEECKARIAKLEEEAAVMLKAYQKLYQKHQSVLAERNNLRVDNEILKLTKPIVEASHMKELIGRCLLGVRVSNDWRILAFETDKGIIAYTIKSRGSSHSQFTAVEGISDNLNDVVMGVQELYVADRNYEEKKFYAYELGLNDGSVRVEFENDWIKHSEGLCLCHNFDGAYLELIKDTGNILEITREIR